jgi:DNA (cytosine-5)-methyltransferase 1
MSTVLVVPEPSELAGTWRQAPMFATSLRAVSLFSGVGGFELGLERAGIQTVLQVENDPWCLSVLARHWPGVQRIDDVRQVDAATLQGRCRDMVSVGVGSDAEWLGVPRGWGDNADSVDLVYGGFPCQDLSVAGKRAGLRGERSGLWHEFQRVLSELRPRWCLIENVPGLLSSNGGADFGVLLRGLDDLGYGLAWRVLDARWFGVPQRRRRVFLVGCLGDARRAVQVLAVCESCGGHSPSRCEEGQDTSHTLDDGARGASVELPMIAASLSAGGHPESNMPGRHHEDDENLIVGSTVDEDSARPLVARASGYRMDMESETFVVASPVRASDGHHGHSSGRGDGADNLIAWDDRNHNLIGGVRRLTPLECERLMGWADDHTRWTADGREIPDSHRYRMIGNGVVAPVAEWIGHRLIVA